MEQQFLVQVISDLCKKMYSVDVLAILERPDPKFGDFTTNVAMQLAGKLGKSPRDIAQELAAELDKIDEIKEVGVAGPGFINLFLQDSVLINYLNQENSKPLKGLKILVEYSQPNPFKPLHAGHLYTTLVGDVIARMVENAGAETVRLNYGGDVGMHVGKSMWAILKNIGGEDIDAVKKIPVAELASWMGKMYVEGTNAHDEDNIAKSEIKELNKRVYQLHDQNDHESAFAQIYWYLREQSYEFFKRLYIDLQVTEFDRFIPESEVTPLGIKTVKEQLKKGVFTESDGAVIFEGEKFGLHTRVFINSEGIPTYEAKDVGLSLTKWKDYEYDESIITTGNEQSQYMQVLVKAVEQFAPDPALRTRHITHGMVKLAGGLKMSSRKGNILSADDILQAAREAGQASGQAENEDVMLAGVKYALIKNRIGGDIIYDPKESISTEGNSGPYLQYAYARASSIKAKSVLEPIEPVNLEAGERQLVLQLSKYQEVLDAATIELQPHLIATYLYELAQEFNRFYENNKVVGDNREAQRIWIIEKYTHTLKSGLNLLGIKAPEKM